MVAPLYTIARWKLLWLVVLMVYRTVDQPLAPVCWSFFSQVFLRQLVFESGIVEINFSLVNICMYISILGLI